MYSDIVEDLRFGLGITAENDDVVERGVRKAAKKLLRAWNFRDSVKKAVLPIGPTEDSVTLPADAGKVRAVILTKLDGTTRLYKKLLRRPEGQLPVHGGPTFYYAEGRKLFIDTAMPAVELGYYLWIWYQSIDPDVNEDWLTEQYDDVLEHSAGKELALKLRKTEAAQVYDNLWQEDIAILGRFLPEIEFSDMDIGFGEGRSVTLERYPVA